MKIFYHCHGGAHTSVVCAAIHLNYISECDVPKAHVFKEIPFYDEMEKRDIGILYVGNDEYCS